MSKLTEKEGYAAFWANVCFQENNNVIGFFDHDHAEGGFGPKKSYYKSYIDELEKMIKKFNIKNPEKTYFWVLFDHFYDEEPGEMEISKDAKGADIAEGLSDPETERIILDIPGKGQMIFDKNRKKVIETLKKGPQDLTKLQEDLKKEFDIYDAIDKLLFVGLIEQKGPKVSLNEKMEDIFEKAIKDVDALETKKEPLKAYFLGNFNFKRESS